MPTLRSDTVEEEDGYLVGHDTDDYNVIIFPPQHPTKIFQTNLDATLDVSHKIRVVFFLRGSR